jgi:hypothetical protein
VNTAYTTPDKLALLVEAASGEDPQGVGGTSGPPSSYNILHSRLRFSHLAPRVDPPAWDADGRRAGSGVGGGGEWGGGEYLAQFGLRV